MGQNKNRNDKSTTWTKKYNYKNNNEHHTASQINTQNSSNNEHTTNRMHTSIIENDINTHVEQ